MKPRRLSIRSKLFIAFAATGLITGLLVSVQTFQSASHIIKLNQESTVTKLRDIKAEQIGSAINKMTNRLDLFADDPLLASQLIDLSAAYHSINTTGTNRLYKSQCSSELENSFNEKILANLHPAHTIQQKLNLSLGDKAIILQCEFVVNRDIDEAVPVRVRQYTYFHEIIRNTVESFRQRTELDEIILLDSEGYLVYSTVSKFDLGTSFIDGPWADTMVGVAFSDVSQVLSLDYVRMYDFSFYLPNNFQVMALVASPIISDNKMVGVMIGTITPDKFANILLSTLSNSDKALGEHGESYIVGNDMLMRSNSRYLTYDSEQFASALKKIKYDQNITDLMIKSGSSVLLQKVDTASVKNMLNGRSGVHEIKDYLGNNVISAYAPLDIPFLDWGVVVELDDYEANALVRKLKLDALQAMLFVMLLIVLITIFVSRAMIKPISSLTSMVLTFAEGDYSRRLNDQNDDEMGKLARAFDSMADTITERSHATLRANNALMQEVEERRQIQGELQRKRDFVSSILDSQRLISIITKSDGAIIRINKATEEIVGYSIDELSIITDNLFSKIDLLQKDLSEIIKLVLAGQHQKFEMDLYTKSGDRRVISWVVSKLERSISELPSLECALVRTSEVATDSTGVIDNTGGLESFSSEIGAKDSIEVVDAQIPVDTYLIWSGLDITEQRKAEADLEDQARIIQSLTSGAQDGIFITDDDGKVVTWNVSAEKMFGYDQSEIQLEQVVPKLFPMEYKDIFKQAPQPNAKHEGLTVDAEGVHKDGHKFPVEVSISAISIDDRRSTFYVVRDTSIRMMREQELQDAYEKASIAEQAKTVFLANMSHEIRTPLNGILGFVEILNHTKLNNVQSDYLKIISGSADSLIMIVNEIFDFSKIESGHMHLEDIEFDLYAQIEYAAELFVVAARDKKIEIVIDIDTKIPTSLIGDPLRVRQIISNLLSNSIKFTAAGGNVVLAAELIKDGNFDCALRLSVIDNGFGIDEEHQLRIFEAFTQEDTSVTRKHGGTGLGLAICSRLLKLMGSVLELESVKGEGSKFWFDLTLSKGKVDATIDKFAGVKVGVLKDTDIHEEILVRYLKALKCDVALYNNLSEISEEHDLKLVFASYVVCIKDEDCVSIDHLIDKSTLVLIGSRDSQRFSEIINKNVRVLARPVSYNKIRALLYDVLIGGKKQVTTLSKKKYVGDILLVEDNVINQKLVAIILSNYNLKCTIVSNGEEALQKIKEMMNKFDIILMDIHMPIMDGVTATQEYIRWAQDSSLEVKPVVALTANVIKEDRDRYLKIGMRDFIAKPIDINALEGILDKYLKIDIDTDVDYLLGSAGKSKLSTLYEAGSHDEASKKKLSEGIAEDVVENIANNTTSENDEKMSKKGTNKNDTNIDTNISADAEPDAEGEVSVGDLPSPTVEGEGVDSGQGIFMMGDSYSDVAVDCDGDDLSAVADVDITQNQDSAHSVYGSVATPDAQIEDKRSTDVNSAAANDKSIHDKSIHDKVINDDAIQNEADMQQLDSIEADAVNDLNDESTAEHADEAAGVEFESVVDRLAPMKAMELKELVEAIGINDVSFINQILDDFKAHALQQSVLLKELLSGGQCQQALEISAKLNGVAVNLRQHKVVELIEKLDEHCLKGEDKEALKTLDILVKAFKKIEMFDT